jgi:hypothetical protein
VANLLQGSILSTFACKFFARTRFDTFFAIGVWQMVHKFGKWRTSRANLDALNTVEISEKSLVKSTPGVNQQ